jgi:hypothetical protein
LTVRNADSDKNAEPEITPLARKRSERRRGDRGIAVNLRNFGLTNPRQEGKKARGQKVKQ